MTADFPPQGPLLLVSPHLDDAALSCATLLERAEPVDVLTVCAGQPRPPRQGKWDQACGFPSSAEAVPTRLAEEREAFAGSAHRLDSLDILESQYLAEPRSHADREAVAEAVGSWAASRGAGTVALPACAGRISRGLEAAFGQPRSARRNRVKRLVGPLGRRALAGMHRRVMLEGPPVAHGDHRFVRDAALAALAPLGQVDVLLYEELPYLWGQPADEEVARIAARWEGAHEIVAQVDRAAKARRVAAYRSQIPHLFTQAGPLGTPEGVPPTERYWRLER